MQYKYFFSLVCCALSANLSAQDVTDYDNRVLSADSLIISDSRMDSLFRTLPEVMITGERPIVKAQPGKLVYDLPRLIGNLPVDNAYDAVKELPGVAEVNGSLQLAGQGVTIILDGKVTTLSTSQLYALLQSIPVSRIEKAEVMYNAPARYQVRGALINITLKQSVGVSDSWQGELYTKYRQKHNEGFEERASLLFNKKKFSTDILYSYSRGRSYSTTDKEAVHSLSDGSVHPMNTHEVARNRSYTHSFRLGTDYNIAKDHQLSFVYNGNYGTYHNRMDIIGTQVSETWSNGNSWLHNGRLDYYTPFGLKAGAELTYYHSPSDQLLYSRLQDEQTDFFTKNSQRINQWKFFLSQEHSLKNGWGLNYGAIYTTSVDNSYQFYTDATAKALSASDAVPQQESALPPDMDSRRSEQTFNIYAGFNKNFGNKLTVDASLAAEHYRTSIWNQWNVYPTINLTYLPAPGHVLQLALSSDSNYPDYWAVQDNISYLGGGYSEVHGNPLLKPAKEYELELTYVLNSKYIFSSWFNYTKDNFSQTLYQSPERLVEIYKCFNYDYQQQAGIQVSMPFNLKKWLNSRLTLIGVWHNEKDSDFWDIPFNRACFFGIMVLNNTFTLSSKPDLKLTVGGMIRSTTIQGIYDLPASGNLDVALRYGFAKGKAILNFYCKDIFETAQVSPRIRFGTQRVTNSYANFRELGVSFTYKFGGYKEKERKEVDTSRFK